MTRTRSLADRARDPSLSGDTTPELGGNLDVNGNHIVSTSNGNIAITPHGSGQVVLDGLSWPTSDGSSNQLLKTDGSGSLSFATVNSDVVSDTTPQLGGSLDVNGNAIVSASNGNISITPNGSGKVILDGLSHPTSDGSSGQFLKTDGSGNLSFDTVNTDLSGDSTPQLGGNLDVNGNSIVSASNGNIAITPNGSGKIILDGLSFPTADGSADTVLKTDGSGNLAFSSVSALSGSGIQQVQDDTSPVLGGTLNANSNQITNVTTIGGAKGVFTSSATGQLTLNSTSSDYMLEFQRSGTSEWWLKASSSSFAIHENGGGDYLTISSDGNVGVGGSPVPSATNYNTATLHVRQAGSSSVGSQIKFTTGASGHTASDGGFIAYWHDNHFYINNQEGGQFRFYSGGTEVINVNSSGHIVLPQTGIVAFNSTSDEYIQGGSGTITMGVNNSAHFKIEDTVSTFGQNDADYTVKIGNSNAGVYVDGDSNIHLRNAVNETVIWGANNSSTYLYYNDAYTLQTRSDGIMVVSTADNDDGTLYLGNDGYARVSSDRYSSFHMRDGMNEYVLWKDVNDAVYLYHNADWTMRTQSNGLRVKSASVGVDGYLYFGYNAGNETYFQEDNSSGFGLVNNNDWSFWTDNNGSSYFYYDGNYKLATHVNGVRLNGALTTGNSNTAYGTSGQVLTSQGNASPVWADAGGGAWEVIGNYTGTNVASVDFIGGTNGFVWNNTYKRIKMYGNAIMNSASSTQGSVMISPLVSYGSSGTVVLSNLCFYIQQWMEGYPEFNASLTTSNEYRGQSNNTSGGYIGWFFIGTRSGSDLGNYFFSTTIGGQSFGTNRRNSYASVELDINSKGLTGSNSWNMFTHTYADHPGFYFYPRRIHGQTSSYGYTEKGLRFALSNTSHRFDYDFTFVGLKP